MSGDPQSSAPLPHGLSESRTRHIEWVKITTFMRPRVIFHRVKWREVHEVAYGNGGMLITYQPITITLICGWRALKYYVIRKRLP